VGYQAHAIIAVIGDESIEFSNVPTIIAIPVKKKNSPSSAALHLEGLLHLPNMTQARRV